MQNNLLPQKWMGKIAPIFSEVGFDLDYEWQLPQLKFWLKIQMKNTYNKHNSFISLNSSKNIQTI